MEFSIEKSVEILERTPKTLEVLLNGLSDDWIYNNEGEDTWNVFDVIGHLVHGEKTDWMERTLIILSSDGDKTFAPFDRFAQFKDSRGKTLQQLLEEFQELRTSNLQILKDLQISHSDMKKTGIHPSFGQVTLEQLLSTWVVHDLNHLSQISRVLAKQYKDSVGSWEAYLRILKS
ncbi:MAG: DinB family protein [Mangrovimonas sp.]|nr:DinB family protein [Mangrovimonas sp.]